MFFPSLLTPNKSAQLITLLAAVFCGLSALTAAANDEASRQYVAGYMQWKEGEEAEKRKDYRTALEKFNSASAIFDSVFASFPDWQPRVVTYRRKKVREDMARVSEFVPAAQRPNANAPIDRPSYSPPSRTTGNTRAPSNINHTYASGANQSIAKLEAQIRDLSGQRENLLDRLDATSETLKRSEYELEQSRIAQASLNEEITRLRTEGSGTQLSELTEKLDLEQKAYSRLEGEYNKMRNDFVESRKEVALLKDDRDKLERERDELKALVQRTGSDDIDALIKENLALKEELKEARGRIELLAKSNEAKDDEIDALKKKVGEVEAQLVKLREENAEYHRRIVALSDKLRKTAKQLDDALLKSREGVAEELVNENKLLRGAIVRQLRKQTARQDKKQLLLAEVSKLEGMSDSLLSQIAEIAGEGIQLTADERALFEDSAIANFIDDSGAIDQTLFAESKGDGVLELPEVTNNDGEKFMHGLNRDLTKFAKSAAYDFLNGKFVESENTYQRIHDVVPDNVYALRNLGIVKMKLEKMDEAEHVLRKAVSLDHEDALSHYMLGNLYFQTDDLEKCQNAMDTSISIKPDLARAHYHLGAIELRNGNLAAAASQFEKVLEIDPDFADAHYNLAWISLNSSPPDRRAARDHYRMTLRLGGKGDSAMEHAIGS